MASAASGSSAVASDRRVGIVYDERMCKHSTHDGEPHPENPDRIRVIWDKLQASGITRRCEILNAKEAKDMQISLVHGKDHVNLVRNISSKQYNSRRNKIASRWNSIYLNEGSSEAAYVAAGSVIELSEKVAQGELNSGFAIVRPPGHHAERDEAMGFCLYNNVAIAASCLLNNEDLGIRKILIVDWDVHHGNGTQKMFYNDPRVLFFSVHRHEFGTFYPGNDDGDYTMIGEGEGAGYNINVPWENARCGDADYLAVWDHILIPVVKCFHPDMIIVSAGFDAAIADPLGGCRVSPYGYSMMLKQLMPFAGGKIVLALEGGYNLTSIANSALACMEVLLDGKAAEGSAEAYPFESTWRVIQAVRIKLKTFWPVLADDLPTKLTSQRTTIPILVSSSDSDSEVEKEPVPSFGNIEQLLEDVIQPLSTLKVDEDGVRSPSLNATKDYTVFSSWRSELSNVEIWYATFGSNMWKPRFLCYIEGGQVDGMQRSCIGSNDKTPPKKIMWKTFPHRLFFGRESTRTWGLGGVAFLLPESSSLDKSHLCLYRITLEQFNDILYQENIAICDASAPFVDIGCLSTLEDRRSMCVEALKKGWYHNVVLLGTERGIPILTMTCSHSDVEAFKSGAIPLRGPGKEYWSTLVRGLVEGGQFSEEDAVAYIKESASRPL
ncbi:hypothetical protein MLD38_021806 [Melastoma candidum]|uniref:Uncharacterized protein n=1 Tax=Melastoma candidum TaxID=119954 RepID=A0ACB9QQC4_9MYRT|nr:hypothetical protein MLD38_021806 [Melastoma candidum]